MAESDREHLPCSKKKRTYLTSFNEVWLKKEEYKPWLSKIDDFTAKCTLCNVMFTVKHDSEKALRTHNTSKRHKESSSSARSNSLMTSFVTRKDSPEEYKVAAIEAASIYHCVNHHQSYLSLDCSMKLNTKLFSDSCLAKKLHCGRTKAEAVIENVIAPKALEIVLEDLGNSSQ